MQTTAQDTSLAEFRDPCRRQMQRKLEDRIKYGFCRVYKPVLDDAPYRAFQTMAEYRAWCEANLPAYLGFQQATSPPTSRRGGSFAHHRLQDENAPAEHGMQLPYISALTARGDP